MAMGLNIPSPLFQGATMQIENTIEASRKHAEMLKVSTAETPLRDLLRSWKAGETECDEMTILDIVYHFWKITGRTFER
jgi:hypothetical protein